MKISNMIPGCHWRVGRVILLAFFCGLGCSGADSIDECVDQEMRAHGIPGVSLAIVEDGQIVSTRVYGRAGEGRAVTPGTLFQAGSVSKVLTAVGALRLVGEGKISLDEDVNHYLKEWKVPESEFTRTEKVTVRRILDHTAGFTVHGFEGYRRGEPLPGLLEILDGVGRANNAPIRVGCVPGSKWAYSGGGYVVLQKLMIDVTGEPFPQWMRENVLRPLGMKESTFQQPLPKDQWDLTAAGHEAGGAVVPGEWHVYPEMAAAGLWTTPDDLSQLVMALQRAKQGGDGGVISPEIFRLMTTPGMHNDALGLFVSGPEKGTYGHDGRNEGFDTLLSTRARKGMVIMTNINENDGVLSRISEAIWRDGNVPSGSGQQR